MLVKSAEKTAPNAVKPVHPAVQKVDPKVDHANQKVVGNADAPKRALKVPVVNQAVKRDDVQKANPKRVQKAALQVVAAKPDRQKVVNPGAKRVHHREIQNVAPKAVQNEVDRKPVRRSVVPKAVHEGQSKDAAKCVHPKVRPVVNQVVNSVRHVVVPKNHRDVVRSVDPKVVRRREVQNAVVVKWARPLVPVADLTATSFPHEIADRTSVQWHEFQNEVVVTCEPRKVLAVAPVETLVRHADQNAVARWRVAPNEDAARCIRLKVAPVAGQIEASPPHEIVAPTSVRWHEFPNEVEVISVRPSLAPAQIIVQASDPRHAVPSAVPNVVVVTRCTRIMVIDTIITRALDSSAVVDSSHRMSPIGVAPVAVSFRREAITSTAVLTHVAPKPMAQAADVTSTGHRLRLVEAPAEASQVHQIVAPTLVRWHEVPNEAAVISALHREDLIEDQHETSVLPADDCHSFVRPYAGPNVV